MKECKTQRHHIRILTYILLVGIIGCSGGTQRTAVSNSDSAYTIANVPIEEWMDQQCGKCHNQAEFYSLFSTMKKMPRSEFKDSLAGVVHDDIKLSDRDLDLVLEWFQKKKLLEDSYTLSTRSK